MSGEPFGGVEVFAHAENHKLTYDVKTRLEATELSAYGQTDLRGDNETEATLNFSRFNIGAILKLAHINGLTGESALAGKVTVHGPLRRPEQLRGEALLKDVTVTIAGVHLRSEGDVHATLADGRIHLDPLHITGEETDLTLAGRRKPQGQTTVGYRSKRFCQFEVGRDDRSRPDRNRDVHVPRGGTWADTETRTHRYCRFPKCLIGARRPAQ